MQICKFTKLNGFSSRQRCNFVKQKCDWDFLITFAVDFTNNKLNG